MGAETIRPFLTKLWETRGLSWLLRRTPRHETMADPTSGLPLSRTLRRLLALVSTPPCWVDDETARLRAMRRAFIVSCREDIAAAGTKEMWLEPQIEKVQVSVLNDIGKLLQADEPKARRGKEVTWKNCWTPLDYYLGATLDQGEDVTDLAYFTDVCSYCLEGPGALKKCQGCDKKPCTQGQMGWPAYIHHYCVSKAAGSMAEDLEPSHVCPSCLQTSCGNLLKSAGALQVARKKAGRDDEKTKNLEYYCKEMGSPMPKQKAETIDLWCDRMSKYLLDSIKEPGSLVYYDGEEEQAKCRAKFEALKVIRRMNPVPVWPLSEAAAASAAHPSVVAESPRTRLRSSNEPGSSNEPLIAESEGRADEGIEQPDEEGAGQGQNGAEAPVHETEPPAGPGPPGWDHEAFEKYMNLINLGVVLGMLAKLAGCAS